MDFYVRDYQHGIAGSVNFITPYAVSTTQAYESLFDVRNMLEFYIQPPAYFPDAKPGQYDSPTSIPYGTPITAETFLIDDSTTGNYFGFMSGAYDDPARQFTLYGNSNYITVGDERVFTDLNWAANGYTDPYSDLATFKTEICTQIKGAIELYNTIASLTDWNVFIYRYSPARTMVWYWPGNDPNYDDLITI